MLSNILMQSEPQIEAVIFDLDDTLISWESPTLSWREYLAPMMARATAFLSESGHIVGTKEFGIAFGHHVRTAWERSRETGDTIAVSLAGVLDLALNDLMIPAADVDIQAMMHAFDWEPMPGVRPYDDAHAVLTELQSRGYKLGLITNAFQPMWMRDVELEQDDLIKYFECRITSGDTGFMKPDPAIFWRMMGMLGTTPDKAMYIGDNPSRDVAGANRSGMTSVLIDPPHLNKSAENDEQIPDYTITSLTELLDLPIIQKA